MHIHQLVLRDFRNYERADLSLTPGLTAFVGLNGQGKTNLLESICFLSTTKSPRTHQDRDLIRWEQEFLCARAEFRTTDSPESVAELVVTRQGDKKAKLNGAERRLVSDWIGHLNVSAFFPEDVALVSGRPTLRRQFLDLELAKLGSLYRYHWLHYRRVLSQRNALLRDLKYGGSRTSGLPELSEQLATHGAEMIVQRHEYMAALAGTAAGVHRRLSKEQEALTTRYECSLGQAPLGDLQAVRATFAQELEVAVPKEIERGATRCGPHRDDISLRLQGKDLRRYASQGQRRSASLALRVAAAKLMGERLGDFPILVLDDALSELDAERRYELLDLAMEMDQVLLTTTDSELGRLEGLTGGIEYEVREGVIVNAT